MIRVVVIFSLLLIVQSCNVTKRAKKPIWESVEPEATAIHQEGRLFFRLSHRVFIDSLVNFSKDKNRTEKSLLMPIPSFEGYMDNYYFTPISNPDSIRHPDVYGFIGVNKLNKRDINSLYIDKDKILIEWDTEIKRWRLQFLRSGDVDDIYGLADLNAFRLRKIAPNVISK